MAPTRRRWFQFSLRTLFLTMFVVSALCAAFAWWTQQARRQAAAANALGELGVGIFYTEHYVPGWLQSLLGDDYFQSVESVMAIEMVSANTSKVVRQLVELPKLRAIRLSEPKFADEDLQLLGECRDLESICLFQCADLPENGLRHLLRLKELRELRIQAPSTTEGDLRVLGQVPKLIDLELFHTEISIGSMAQLGKVSQLEQLSLQRCSRPVTDDDIEPLTKLKNLTDLLITPTEITDAGLERLRNALPSCRILIPDNTSGAKGGEYMPLVDPGP